MLFSKADFKNLTKQLIDHILFVNHFFAIPYRLRVKCDINGIANIFLFILIVANFADSEWNFPTLAFLVVLGDFFRARLFYNCCKHIFRKKLD